MRREYLRAAAEAAANVSSHHSDCYHHLIQATERTRAQLIAHYKYHLQQADIKPKYISAVVIAAVTELDYPTRDLTKYAWSANQRAAFAGIAKATWSRNQLCKHINFIIDDIRVNAVAVASAIDSQLLSD